MTLISLSVLQQGDLADMLAETTHMMMVLAMHILRDAAADSCKTGAGHHGGQPAARRERGGDLANTRARLDLQLAGVGIKGDQAIEPAHIHRAPVGIQRRIPVRAAHSKGGRGRQPVQCCARIGARNGPPGAQGPAQPA